MKSNNYVEKHKNFEKAIGLLPVRFQNCDLHEVGEKLYWDLQYVEDELREMMTKAATEK